MIVFIFTSKNQQMTWISCKFTNSYKLKYIRYKMIRGKLQHVYLQNGIIAAKYTYHDAKFLITLYAKNRNNNITNVLINYLSWIKE